MKVVWFLADVVFSFSLLLATAVRGSVLSSLYLAAWIIGILYTFKSRLLTVFTLFVAICGVGGNIFSIVWYKSKLKGAALAPGQSIEDVSPLPGKEILSIMGINYMVTWDEYLLGIGPDALIFLSSIIHLYLLKKQFLKAHGKSQDLVASSSHHEHAQDGNNSVEESYFSKEALIIIIGGSEVIALIALFLCALSSPGVLCGAYFLIFLYCLIVWTVKSPRITRRQLENGESTFCYFFGPSSMRFLVTLTIPVLLFCHAFQYPRFHDSEFGRKVGKYANIFVLPGSWDNWPGYVFYGAQLFLLATASRTCPIYKQLASLPVEESTHDEPIPQRRQSLAETLYHEPLSSPTHSLRQRRWTGERANNASTRTSFYSAHESSSSFTKLSAKELLSRESLIVRIFLEDRGVLGAIVAALFWSVSYPSYLMSILFGVALLTLGSYGLVIPRMLLIVLSSYAVFSACVVYLFDIPALAERSWVSDLVDELRLGISVYPLIDLAIQNACLFVMCFCLRIRLRYRDLLQELREEKALQLLNQEVRISVLSDMSATSSQVQQEHIQMHRMKFVEILALWFKDLQCVFVSLLDTLVLFTIFVTVLSTSVNLLQTGYLVLAAFLSVFKRLRRRLWRWLLSYALAVCFLIYMWNVICPTRFDSVKTDTWGLTCFAGPGVKGDRPSGWEKLWPTLFTAQLILILQAVIQLVIYMRSDAGRAEREAMLAQAPGRPVFFISRITLEIDMVFRFVGGIVTYVGFLLLGFIYEVDSSGRVTLFGLLQVFLMFTLLGSHMASMIKSPRGNSTKTQFLWRVVLVYEVLVLVVRYIYQFEAVATYIHEKWHLDKFMTLEDVGLHRHSATTKLSGLFVYLLPTAVLAALTAWNLRSMKRKLPLYEILPPGRSRFIDAIIVIVNELKRMVFVNSPIVLLVFNMAIVCRNINAFNVTYLTILITTLFKPKWTGSWKSLFWLSSFFILCLYAFQFRSLQPDRLELLFGPEHAKSFEDNASWIGLARVNKTMAELMEGKSNNTDTANGGNYYHSSIWSMTWEHMVVMLLCLVTRASQFWDPEKDAKPNSKKQRPRKPSEWHASSSNMSEDTPFLKSVQDFLIRFASEGSVTLTMLMLLVSAFIHLNVISVMYLLVVRWIMVSHPITVCRNWNYLVIMLLFVCVTQYFIMLWFPPFLDWPRNTTVPWKWLEHHDEYAEYLALNFQHPMGLFSDYCCILFVFMIPGAKPYYLEIEKRTMVAELAAHETDSGQNHRDTLTASVVPGDANDFTTNAKENQQPWRLLVFMVMNYWVFVLLIMVFVSGCIRSGVASGIYLAFAIYMLVNVNDVDSPESKMLSRLREFSWGYMFLLVLFQIPVFGNPTEYCTLGTHVNGKVCLSAPAVLDLNKFPKNYPSAPDVGATVPVLSIVIFWMINIQELIYQSPLYDYVRAFTSRESDQSQRRCRALHEEVLMDRLERWQALKHEKQAAILRLKSIISRMVNKVEEMMDIASGLNYSLPPSAPQPPTIVTEETTQNSVTLVWNAPESPLHRIRSYTITRQVYPPTTLLGDYSYPIEVKASLGTRFVVDGLRPGTTYQFKVAASSRMGEGPFSAPSVPIQTFPLNWGGTCVAGWVYYRKCLWPQPWYSKLWTPKELPRYAVVDSHAFVWYKNEALALKHRSMKKRKRMKTSFLTKDVSVFDLSEQTYRANEMSDEMYALQIVATARNSHQVRYTVLLEIQQQFNHWVSDLSQLVPRHAIGPRLEAYLDANGMSLPPIPESSMFDDEDENFNGPRSEWSSVTGDESWLNDAEDEEQSESKNFVGLAYLAFYNFFYMLQDISLRHEEQIYEEDDEQLPSWFELFTVMLNALRSHTRNLCCIIFICSFVSQGDILNMVYVFAAFGFLLLENPRPHSYAWNLIMRYSFWVVFARYFFQLPVFCQNINSDSVLYPSMQPWCPDSLFRLKNRNPIQPMVYFGLYKFDGIANPQVDTMWKGVAWNFVVILSILFHRRELQLRGLWLNVDTEEDSPNLLDRQRTTVMSRDSLDDPELYDVAAFLARHKDDTVKATPGDFHVREMPQSRPAALSKVVAFEGTPDDVARDDDHPRQVTSPREALLQTQLSTQLSRDHHWSRSQNDSTHNAHNDEEETRVVDPRAISPREALLRAQSRMSASPRASMMSESPRSLREGSSGQLEQNETQPLLEFVDQVPTIPKKPNKVMIWLESTFPSTMAFLARLWPTVPEHWDKDISEAMMCSKPGRDYFAAMVLIPFICIIYAFLFFKYFGEPVDNSETFSINLSDSMLNGYMVLIIFFELIVFIWDRAAFVCSSLRIKVALHFTVLIGVHLGLWLMLPLSSKSYFQSRVGLQGFYVLHCIYLWISSYQIKFGYQVFRSNHHNKKSVEEQSWTHELYGKGFKVFMALPFAFEIRCLLDWMCSKTALNKDMWLLLEETAATLFLVRHEMDERIRDAVYLKGNKRHPVYKKFLTGGFILFVLLFCVIAPLAMFSSLNPSTQENSVKTVTVKFGLLQGDGTLQEFYTNGDSNGPRYGGLKIKATDTFIQKNSFSSYSKDLWISSPPLRRELVNRLRSSESLKWSLRVSFSRDGPQGNQDVTKSFEQSLTALDRTSLISLVQGTNVAAATPASSSSILGSNASMATALGSNLTSVSLASDDIIVAPNAIRIKSFFNPVLKVPASSAVTPRTNYAKRDLSIQRNVEDGVSWWVINSTDASNRPGENDGLPINCQESPEDKDGFCLITVSDNIVSGLTKLGIGSYGLTAAYIFVVFTVGAFFKEMLRGEMYKVLYNELPNPNDLLDLVEGIYIARKEEYIGHLKDEGRLYETLVRMLRSPETLIKLTGSNAIHIPPPKHKLD
ncbi:hypothetical protein AeMF1_002400 [Aphanomyces euteiches]|nr:hypothetical protein AeMF1_002400 [Aphanomyces euteiches]KAH9193590.1 hypothetical protein AeNC1_004444 [Aphanomyces euteiches]